MDVHSPWFGHARLSGWALLPLGQLHPSALLDPEHGNQPAIITPERARKMFPRARRL
jgi:hypothetical protein